MFEFSLIPGGGNAIVTALMSQPDANRGLIWERYLPTLSQGANNSKSAVEAALGKFVKLESKDERLGERRKRFERALTAMGHAGNGMVPITLRMRVAWRLACGLGSAHPTNNGFSFDPVTGSPYLPGSSVKGMCRQWAHWKEWDVQKINRLFGPEHLEGEEGGAQGQTTFFDAFPETTVTLHMDIVNCHHMDYNIGNVEEPLETDNPNPAFFLSMMNKAVFLFTVLVHGTADADDIKDLLKGALMNLGIGAKTAAGYGVFTEGERHG
ncbi:MAG: type III-B CRISPR module RAMP protein Cmr6 [Magnetococcus sp. WYHC-3]